LDQLADASEHGPRVLPLFSHRSEPALELAQAFNPFLPEAEELSAFLDPAADRDHVRLLRGHMVRVMPLPPPCSPSDHRTEQSRDKDSDRHHE
jgi:hypothetical protein